MIRRGEMNVRKGNRYAFNPFLLFKFKGKGR